MNSGMKKTTGALKRKPFLTPVWLAGLAAAVVLSFATWLWGTADSTIVIVIRHAEKVQTGADDPPLSPAGEARAQLIARLFGDRTSASHVTAIYVSPLMRSRMTAAPLAAALGLKPVEMPADDPRDLVRHVIKDNAGGRVLIVGHADTVPRILAALGADRAAEPIEDGQYDRMYVVAVPRIGHVNVLRVNY